MSVFSQQLKPLLLFPAQILCAFLLIVFPVVLHLLYIKATGYESAATFVSDLNFLGDLIDLGYMLGGLDKGAVSLGGHFFRVTGISVHILASSLLWSLCTHIAASCLLDAKPPLIQSLKGALRASRNVLAMSLLLFVAISLLSLVQLLVISFIAWSAGGEMAPLDMDMEENDFSSWCLFVVCSRLNVYFCFAPVIASLTPDMQCSMLMRVFKTGYDYANESSYILLLLHLQFYVPHLNYLKFWMDVEEGNIVAVALAIMSITSMALLKVYIVIYICALFLHKRAAYLNADLESKPSQAVVVAKVLTPFDTQDKATILGVVSALDGALVVNCLSIDPSSPRSITPCKAFDV